MAKKSQKTRKQETPRQVAMRLLGENLGGMRYTQLVREVMQQGQYNKNAVETAVWKLSTAKEVDKPERGLYRLAKYDDGKLDDSKPLVKGVKEDDFYQSFADWLKSDVEDVTHAIALGGNKFGDRWGTPDVIGKKQARPTDIIKGETEIVSAEIKLDTNQLIQAFGQACAYKLFSHKCYLVIPGNSPPESIARLDSLCQLFGLGFVLFDADKDNPNYQIRTRPQKHKPDLFYTNKYIRLIEDKLWK